jgi:hypothetical protein
MAQVRLILKAVFDDKGIKKALRSFNQVGEAIDSAFATVSVGAGLATAAIGKLAVDSIKAASDLAESTNAVNVAFKDSAKGVLAIGENSAESFGLAKNEFNAAAVRFSAFAERVVGEGGNVAGFIKDITTRAADFASVFNIEVSEALSVFQSGLSGEAEPLKRFGINLLDSEVKLFALRTGLIGVGETMTEQEKVQARYGLLLESTAKTAGDFANTSDGLANTQRILKAKFTDLQAEIGNALLPSITNLVKALADRLIPVFEELGQFLNSPEGKKIIEDTAKAISDFVIFVIDNIEQIADFTIKLSLTVVALKGLKIAFEFATKALQLYRAGLVLLTTQVTTATGVTTAFGAALKLLPWAALIIGAGLFVTSIADYANAVYGSKINTEGLTEAQAKNAIQVESLRRLLGQYEYALENSTAANRDLAKDGVAKVRDELARAEYSIKTTIGELNRFNNMNLGRIRGEIRESAGELNRFRNLLNTIVPPPPPPPLGETEAEKRQKAFEKVSKFIKDAQKDLAKAQDTYNDTIAKAQKKYAESVIKTEKDFAKKLSDIVQQSQDRLRSAFASATQTNVAQLFETFKTEQQKRKEEFEKAQSDLVEARKKLTEADTDLKETLADPNRTEKQLRSATEKFNEAKTAFEKINAVVAKGLTKENPVEALLNSLREKLRSSQGLLSKAGQLASAGFSQTFIEQIVAAGTETGNELGQAILDATPETQRELQNLFSVIESTAETGMDALAKQIFEKSKFATRELATLYENTQKESAKALEQLNEDFNEEIIDANTAFIDAIKTIREAFNENIKSMKGDLGGLETAVDDFLKKLGKVEAGAKANIPSAATTGGGGDGAVGGLVGINIPISELSGATNILIDSFDDVTRVVQYLLERTEAARRFANQSALAGRTTEAMSALETSRVTQAQANFLREQSSRAIGTVININVKTDSTQSLAMVGKTLGNTITKYVQTGGQVVVSPVG